VAPVHRNWQAPKPRKCYHDNAVLIRCSPGKTKTGLILTRSGGKEIEL
jgi:hypothetical protein